MRDLCGETKRLHGDSLRLSRGSGARLLTPLCVRTEFGMACLEGLFESLVGGHQIGKRHEVIANGPPWREIKLQVRCAERHRVLLDEIRPPQEKDRGKEVRQEEEDGQEALSPIVRKGGLVCDAAATLRST